MYAIVGVFNKTFIQALRKTLCTYLIVVYYLYNLYVYIGTCKFATLLELWSHFCMDIFVFMACSFPFVNFHFLNFIVFLSEHLYIFIDIFSTHCVKECNDLIWKIFSRYFTKKPSNSHILFKVPFWIKILF